MIEGGIAQHDQNNSFKSKIPDAIWHKINDASKLTEKYVHIQQSFLRNARRWEKVCARGLVVDSRRNLFLEWLDIRAADLKGKKLDAGCVNGEVELGLAGTGSTVFAINYFFLCR